ncbi:MAG: hypothetical protein HGA19_23590 [Oscillochloris sp.]|nr:hypothetical protein [Oscillochloris sp.]
METSTTAPKPISESAEAHQRFRQLRLLIGDPQRRQRLIFGFSLLSFAIVSLLAYLFGIIILAFGIEFYLRDLTPRAPTQQEGLVGAHDQAVENTGGTHPDGYRASGGCSCCMGRRQSTHGEKTLWIRNQRANPQKRARWA